MPAGTDDAMLAPGLGFASIAHLLCNRLDEAERSRSGAGLMILTGNDIGALQGMRTLWAIAWRRNDLAALRRSATIGAEIEERFELGGYSAMGRYWLAVAAVASDDGNAAAMIDTELARPGLATMRRYIGLRTILLRRNGQPSRPTPS